MIAGNPLVSILTPTFNRADFLGQMIESVLSQTFRNFELIIVDDGSTDDTRSLVEGFRDERITYRYQENSGQSVARNAALKLATGQYICFLDSDNAWLPDKLEKSLKAFEQNPDVDVVYGDCITINEHGDEISRKNMRRHSGYIAPLMLRDNFISMNTTMTRRHCFDEMGGMSARRRVADDYDLWLRFSSRYRFLYIPEFLAYYRVMDNQISSDKELRFQSNEEIIHDFLKAYPDAVTSTQARQGLGVFYTRKARYLAGAGKRGRAVGAVLRAFLYNPLAASTWRGLCRVICP
jgi:glycosyltransferase involved in cell wall biosynthesis